MYTCVYTCIRPPGSWTAQVTSGSQTSGLLSGAPCPARRERKTPLCYLVYNHFAILSIYSRLHLFNYSVHVFQNCNANV